MKYIILIIILCFLPITLAEENILIGNESVYNKSVQNAEFECYESAQTYEQDEVGFVLYGPHRYYNICDRDMKNSTKLLFPPKTLAIYSCVDGMPAINRIFCKLDCFEGTCLTNEEFPLVRNKCVDSDGGDDAFKRGYTTSAFGRSWDVCVNHEEAETSKCVGENCFLTEYICDSHKRNIEKVRIQCEYGCSGGACFNCPECVLDGVCYGFTEKVENLFCNASFEWESLYRVGSSCEQSYQCDTQFCRNGTCFIECDGCWHAMECLSFNTIKDDMYCDATTQEMIKLKYVGDTCKQNLECDSQKCYKGICRPACDGCYTPEWDCKPMKLRFRDMYCGLDKELHPLKTYNDFCVDDYECGEGYCDTVCTPYSLWNRMMTWLRNFF